MFFLEISWAFIFCMDADQAIPLLQKSMRLISSVDDKGTKKYESIYTLDDTQQ